MPNIVWSRKAEKQLATIDTRYQKTIKNKVASLVTFPQVQGLDIKKLKGYEDKYRLSIGQYRVIFRWLKDKKPQIINIEKVLKRDNRTYRPS